MAVDLSALAAPRATQAVTLTSGVGDVTAVTLPKWSKILTVRFLTSAGGDEQGYFEFSGTDAAAKTAHAWPVASGAAYAIRTWGRKQSPSGEVVIYLAGSSASGIAYIHLETD